MTLLAPAFLLGLLAIGVPLWLHRLSSENPNRQPFSSVMSLEPGEPRRVLAKKLQYLLLLALRIGILVLLALASFNQLTELAQPDEFFLQLRHHPVRLLVVRAHPANPLFLTRADGAGSRWDGR